MLELGLVDPAVFAGFSKATLQAVSVAQIETLTVAQARRGGRKRAAGAGGRQVLASLPRALAGVFILPAGAPSQRGRTHALGTRPVASGRGSRTPQSRLNVDELRAPSIPPRS